MSELKHLEAALAEINNGVERAGLRVDSVEDSDSRFDTYFAMWLAFSSASSVVNRHLTAARQESDHEDNSHIRS